MMAFVFQLASLAGLCLFFFPQNRAALYLPYDGAYMQQVVKLHFEWSLPMSGVMLNPLQGLGGITFPLNYWFSPSALLTYLLGGATPDPVLLYTITGLEFFATVWLLAHACGASRRVAALAGWTAVILVMPFVVPPYENRFTFYPISGLIPWIVEHIAFSNVVIALLLLSRGDKTWRGVAWPLCALAVFLASVVAMPFSVVLSLPLLGVFALHYLFGTPFPGLAPRWRVVLLGFMCAALIFPMAFIGALLLPTVPSFFNSELIYGRGTWAFISIVFHNFLGLGWLSTPTYLLGLAGGIVAWRSADRPLRTVARIYVVYALSIVLTGCALTFAITWYRGPTLMYFEWFTWPFLFIFAAHLVEALTRRYGHVLLSPELRRLFVTGRLSPWLPGVVLAPVLAGLLVLAVNRPRAARALPMPPATTAPVSFLEQQCALRPGEPWKGSVATFTGYSTSAEPTSWQSNAGYDQILWAETGNDLRATGLWWHNIPTLFTYNQYLSPELYYLASRLLATPKDAQQRSVLVLTRPDVATLRLLGVRFVITERGLPEGPELLPPTSYMPWDPAIRRPKGVALNPLLMYELKRPNRGDYSPTRQIVEPTAAGALARMREPGFDAERSVVLTKPLEGSLSEAQGAVMAWDKRGLGVRASSPGRSLLVLPLQYSNCLEVESAGAEREGAEPRLVRADIGLAGLVFDGRADVKIRYNFGPFSNPMCRIKDYLDDRAMRLGEDALPKPAGQ